MKKLIFTALLAVLGFSATAFAQNNTPTTYFVEGRTWNYKMKDAFLDDNYLPVVIDRYFSLKIEGDTVFNGVDCKKIYYKENDSTCLFAYAYEENLKIYFYFLKSMKYFCSPSTDWELFFNFNLKVGELYRPEEYIAKIDTIEVQEIKYPRFWIGLKIDGEIGIHSPIVYSIGGDEGLWGWAIQSITGYPSYSCIGIYNGDKCIFERSDYRKSPINTAIEDITPDKQSSSDFYDLQGRKVKNPTKGLYIKEGKKILVK